MGSHGIGNNNELAFITQPLSRRTGLRVPDDPIHCRVHEVRYVPTAKQPHSQLLIHRCPVNGCMNTYQKRRW